MQITSFPSALADGNEVKMMLKYFFLILLPVLFPKFAEQFPDFPVYLPDEKYFINGFITPVFWGERNLNFSKFYISN
jgi:hypothetical protein